MSEKIRTHREPRVYRNGFELAMEIFELSKRFPSEEKYSMTDQIRRSSRSVCANIAEAWRRRRYEKSFISKLNESEAEAAETQVWLEFALNLSYITEKEFEKLFKEYEVVSRQLVKMINSAENWVFTNV